MMNNNAFLGVPLYMEGQIVAVVQWERGLHSNPIGTSNTPMWVDLMTVDPLLEIHSIFLLK